MKDTERIYNCLCFVFVYILYILMFLFIGYSLFRFMIIFSLLKIVTAVSLFYQEKLSTEQGKRSDLTCGQLDHKLKTAEKLGDTLYFFDNTSDVLLQWSFWLLQQLLLSFTKFLLLSALLKIFMH